MNVRAYSIYDRKALIYSAPFYQATDSAAVRSLGDVVTDLATAIGRHPNDYVLYFVGEFDDQKGALIPASPLVHIIDAMALVPVKAPFLFESQETPLPANHFSHGE